MMNVHHASLFPDLLGAAQFCNVMVAEEAIGYRQAEIEQEKTDATITETQPEKPAAPAAERQVQSLRDVLAAPADAAGVEPARMDLIALELAAELSSQQFVDWEKRDSIKAAMRNSARVVLRRLGYPAAAREAVLDQLLVAMQSKESGNGST
jgi:hypothetical protein